MCLQPLHDTAVREASRGAEHAGLDVDGNREAAEALMKVVELAARIAPETVRGGCDEGSFAPGSQSVRILRVFGVLEKMARAYSA